MAGHIQRDRIGGEGDLVVVVVGGDNQAVGRSGLEQLKRRAGGQVWEEGVMLRDHFITWFPHRTRIPEGATSCEAAERKHDQSHGSSCF